MLRLRRLSSQLFDTIFPFPFPFPSPAFSRWEAYPTRNVYAWTFLAISTETQTLTKLELSAHSQVQTAYARRCD